VARLRFGTEREMVVMFGLTLGRLALPAPIGEMLNMIRVNIRQG
jgi:hypothetical protein